MVSGERRLRHSGEPERWSQEKEQRTLFVSSDETPPILYLTDLFGDRSRSLPTYISVFISVFDSWGKEIDLMIDWLIDTCLHSCILHSAPRFNVITWIWQIMWSLWKGSIDSELHLWLNGPIRTLTSSEPQCQRSEPNLLSTQTWNRVDLHHGGFILSIFPLSALEAFTV